MATDVWPAFTTQTPVDVIIAAVSLNRLVDWCGTPCVHSADAAIPGSGGRPSETELASVVITRVVAVDWRSDLRLHVSIDANLAKSRPAIAEARLIGRLSSVDLVASVTLESSLTGTLGFATCLPADIVVGDLLVIPCRGATTPHDVRASTTGPSPLTSAADDGDCRCGK
jgi:hypothetical protein